MEYKVNTKGFSLIELMAVVTIIALLFAFAIPAYQRYLIRSQVSRVVMETGNLKTAIETCINNGLLEVGKASEEKCDTNATPSSILEGDSQGDNGNTPNFGVPQATINADGTATIIGTFGNTAYPVLTAAPVSFIRWSRSTNGGWICESTADSNYNDATCP